MEGWEHTFGNFVLNEDGLKRDGRPVALGGRALALLRALAKADGSVSRAALVEAGWPGTIVEEGNLTVQIAALRKTLGARDDGQEWIVTVPRIGYRLVRAGAEPSATTAASVLPALAVLPFQNLSGDSEQEYFADGVVEDITTALSLFRNFVTISRNSSFVYKGRAVDVRQVARELGVRYLLEGSVRRSGTRLRVTAQLLDGGSGGHLWAKTYDGIVEDVFDMQDRITAQVASTIYPMIEDAEIARSRAKRTESLGAYDLLLQAVARQYTEHMSSNIQSYELLERAIELDPHYAPALAEASFLLASRAAFGWPSLTSDDRTRAIELARRALRAANGDARTQAQVAVILMHADHAYGESLQLARNAIERNPNYLLALAFCSVVELHCGDVHRTLELAGRFVALSPADAGVHLAMAPLAHANMMLGNFAEAVRWAERTLSANDEYQATYWFLVAGNAMLGRMDEARRWLVRLRGLNPNLTIALLRAGQPDFSAEPMSNIYEGLRLAGLPEG